MDQALTVVAPILPDRLDALQALLAQISGSLGKDGCLLDTSRLTTTHFLRWVILPSKEDAPARLLLESNHDGPCPGYVRALFAQAGAALDAVYHHCADYPARGVADAEAVLAYFQAHAVPTQAFYTGYRGCSVQTVQAALRARTALAQFLDCGDRQHLFHSLSAAQVWEAVQAEARRQGIASPPPAPNPLDPSRLAPLAFGGAALGLVALLTRLRLWPALLGLLSAFLLFLRLRETQDAAAWRASARARYLPSYAGHARTQALAVAEDLLAQNQLTHVVPVRPGRLRRGTLRLVLGAINTLAKWVFNRGSLGGIPTIHFARWVLLDEGRLLVFFSNYDGSWDNYLGDFVDRAARGLTGVWSNTEDFPPTRFLLWDGARDIEVFKSWTRAHQVLTQVWYSAYPENTVVNIREALALMENLGRPPGPEASAWLRGI